MTMSNDSNGGRQNYVRREFDAAQRERLDVEGFWQSSRGSLTAVIGIGLIVVAAIVSIVFSFIG